MSANSRAPLLLGLDLGTTNAKAAVYDLHGQCHAEAAVSYPTYFPRPGWAEQHPDDWTQALTAAVRAVVGLLGDRVHDLAGVGLSSQGPGLALVDEQGRPLLEASPTWQDDRCLPQARQLFAELGTLWPGFGGPLNSFAAKLKWALEHQPDVAARARYALGIKDFLVTWLTGEFATEPSSGSGGPTWFMPVFDACGWSHDRLPRILESTDQVGLLRAEVTRAMGLPRPLPMIIGLNDGASATLATGAVEIGEMIITLSTNGVLRVIMPSAVSTETRLTHNLFNWPYIGSLWIAGGQTRGGASTLKWFADAVTGTSADYATASIDDLLAEASQSPAGSRGVVFLPYLMGRGSPHSDPSATGAFAGLTLTTNRSDLTRAVLEGAVFALRDIQEDFIEFGYPPRGLRLSGGGGRSALWRQMIADVLGQPLNYYASDSTLGAAIVAAVGLGFYDDFQSAAQAMTRPEARHKPVVATTELYQTLYGEFQRVRNVLFPP